MTTDVEERAALVAALNNAARSLALATQALADVRQAVERYIATEPRPDLAVVGGSEKDD